MERKYWTGVARVRGKHELTKMVLLTVSLAGLQFTWGVEMSYMNLYLRDLGMSKPALSIVWLAGPLSGLIMQPVVGVLSDNNTSKYGRRRPFIVGGAAAVVGSLLVMAWAPQIVGVFVTVSQTGISGRLVLVLAVVAVLVTDFAVNVVQAASRALIVDTLPSERQEEGNAWASRMIGVGHLVSTYAGYLDLVSLLGGAAGSSQLKSLCVVGSIALIGTSAVTCWAVSERVLTRPHDSSGTNANGSSGSRLWQELVKIGSTLYAAARNVPPRIATIFKVQLCAWYGWFTFLFYASTWVSEVYLKTASESDFDGQDMVGALARVGSRAMMVFSLVSFVFSLILPELVNKRSSITALLRAFNYAWPLDLTQLWLVSHLVYAGAALLSGFAGSVAAATVIAAVFGFSWAVTTWAPFALLAEEILLLHPPTSLELGPVEDRLDVGTLLETGSRISTDSTGSTVASTTGEQSGIYLGIHNVAITMPQLLSTFGSFLIFSVFQFNVPEQETVPKPGQGDGGRAISFTLQVGAATALGAAYYCRLLSR